MSPRPKKTRTCSCPLQENRQQLFKPAGTPMVNLEVITLDHDELEALVLCDEKELSQEAAGAQMGVSRGTVQRLLATGRKKVVGALAASKALAISPVQHAVAPEACQARADHAASIAHG
jgi:predicted DNA-binding protein (UPF0251 family)